MSQKKKRRKAKFFGLEQAPRLSVHRGPPPDFDAIERRAARHAARHEELRYRIAPDCKVHIQFDGMATQEAITKLINYLELGIGDFPKNADDSPTQE